METNYRVLQKIYVISKNFYILSKSFTKHVEVKQLSFPWSCSSEYGNHLFLISNDEKGLSLKKSFWKVYHHSKCFGRYYKSFLFSTSINIAKLDSKLENLFTEELKILNKTLIQYMPLFILNCPLQYFKRLVT